LKKQWAFAGVQALITAAVLLLVSLPALSTSSSVDASLIAAPPAPSSCSSQLELWGPNYSYGSESASPSIVPVLLMQPNATGFICVVYKSVSNGGVIPNATGIDEYLQGFRIFKSQCATEGGGIGCSYHPSASFETSGSKLNSTAPFTSNSTTVYVGVVYSVTALSNATGFYTDSAPRPGCGGLPMAVGYSALKLNATDFVGFFANDCVYTPFVPVEVGVIGIGVTSLKFPDP
jgi:hypothetical protein